MTGQPERRPLASRGSRWAQAAARRLSATSITPNQISQASMLFALIAGAAFWLSGSAEGTPRILLLIAAALGCQLRLLCNLLDGMVAIEGGKTAPDGPFWNEVPDRVSDVLILVGAGYGAGLPALGWAAAAMAVSTAYLREIGRAEGAPSDFSGPMAKPHRMAAVTIAAIAATVEPAVLIAALWIIAVGGALTTIRRARRLIAFLRGSNPDKPNA